MKLAFDGDRLTIADDRQGNDILVLRADVGPVRRLSWLTDALSQLSRLEKLRERLAVHADDEVVDPEVTAEVAVPIDPRDPEPARLTVNLAVGGDAGAKIRAEPDGGVVAHSS